MLGTRGIVLLLIAVIVLAVAGFFGWRWFRNRPSRRATLTPTRLSRVWKAFVRSQPVRFRDAVSQYPIVIVMGPPGSGKSELIDGMVDWKGQARQFLPSSVDDPLLQIYVGRAIVVIELSSAILSDDSPEARVALLKLWRVLPGHRPPTVLAVVDAQALKTLPPTENQNLARLLRGKLNLLAEVYETAINARLCLTHMDAEPGFAEFDQVLQAREIGLKLKLDDLLATEQAPTTLLAPYQRLLSLGLTDLKSGEFLRLVSFFVHSSSVLQPLANLLTSFSAPEPLSVKPKLDELRFFAPGRLTGTRDLFKLPVTYGRPRILPGTRLILQCVFLIASMAAILSLFGLLVRGQLVDARETVAELKDATTSRELGALKDGSADTRLNNALQVAVRDFSELEHSLQGWPILSRSFTNARAELREARRDWIRQAWLKPIVERCDANCAPEQSLYTLAAIYATRESDFGRLIMSNAADWAIVLRVPELAVTTYIEDSMTPYRLPVLVPKQGAAEGAGLAATAEPEWYDALAELELVNAQETITPTRLAELRDKAAALLPKLDALNTQYPYARQAYTFLLNSSHVDVGNSFQVWFRQSTGLRDLVAHHNELVDALTQIRNSTFDEDKTTREPLSAFLARVDHLASSNNHAAQLKIVMRDHVFTLDSQEWSALMTRSLVRLYTSAPGFPFLLRLTPDAATAESTVQRAKYLGTPPYTRATIELAVQPTLQKLADMTTGDRMDSTAERALGQYVRVQLDDFAHSFGDRLSSAYEHCGDSLQALPDPLGGLADMVSTASPFVSCLKRVAENVPTDVIDNPQLAELEKSVALYRPIARMMQLAKDGGPPEYQKYISIIEGVTASLNGHGSAPAAGAGPKPAADAKPAPEATAGGGLGPLLTPEGRVALAIMLQTDASALRQVEAWLDHAGIKDERLRRPFLAPIWLLFDAGRSEIERVISVQWNDERRTVLDAALSEFPFDGAADADIDPADLEMFRAPTGRYWQDVRKMVSPLCVEVGGNWQLSDELLNPPVLPPDLLPITNRLGQLSRTLWDKDGKPRPLPLALEPLPLPRSDKDGSFAVLSFLRIGASTVYGFNQQPGWQPLNLEWWDQGTASVGVKLAAPGDKTSRAESIESTDSAWSFYRLLRKATMDGTGAAVWTISTRGKASEPRSLPIRFAIRGNPWMAFQVTQP